MVKYRQATQKPSNVCFTGRGRMGRAKNSHWVSVFAHNSHRGWITPPLFKQSDNLLNSSDAHKVLLRKPLVNDAAVTGRHEGLLCSPYLPPVRLRLKLSHEARNEFHITLLFTLCQQQRGDRGESLCFEIPEKQDFWCVCVFVFPADSLFNEAPKGWKKRKEFERLKALVWEPVLQVICKGTRGAPNASISVEMSFKGRGLQQNSRGWAAICLRWLGWENTQLSL